MSVVPAGANLDAATGAFSWTPPATTTPTTTRALLDEGSTFTASSLQISSSGCCDYSDPKLTSSWGFYNDNNEFTSTYSNIVHFSKKMRVQTFILMKRADCCTTRVINTV